MYDMTLLREPNENHILILLLSTLSKSHIYVYKLLSLKIPALITIFVFNGKTHLHKCVV